MTKLKTINDFETYFDGKIEFDKIGKEDNPHDFWINRGELKAVVIKRWKHFKKEAKEYYEAGDESEEEQCYGKMEEIKEFNNLTEEDLK